MLFVNQLVGFNFMTGESAFNPGSLSPYLWLQFQDTATLFTTSAGSTNVSADNDPIGRAEDKSGNGRHYLQATAGSRPTYKTNVLNSLAVARLDGTDDYLGGVDLSALTEGEVFIVVKIDTDPPALAAQTGIWTFGASGDASHYPFTDGVIYDDCGATVRKTTGDPAPSLATPRLYNVVSTSSEWTSYIDGTQHHTTGTNTVGFSASASLGKGVASQFLDGDIAEIILFSSKLSAGNKTAMKTYFADRYALTIA